jgi:hypothetical protein
MASFPPGDHTVQLRIGDRLLATTDLSADG